MSRGSSLSQGWQFARLSNERAVLGESPVWSARESCVWWVDVTGRKLFRTEAASGQTQVWPTPEEIGFVVLAREERVVVGMESGLFLFDAARGAFQPIYRLEGRNVRFNDAATDAGGRLWAATCDIDNKAPLGRLLRIDPDLSVHQAVTGLLTPNGLAADCARGQLYLSDSHPDVRTLWCAPLDPASGALGERRQIARFDGPMGRPDGGAVDAEGTYWIAGVGGGTLHGFSPAGERIARVATPMESPTKFTFGGGDLGTVLLTSKSDGEAGSGGHLVRATPGLRGRGESPFAYAPV